MKITKQYIQDNLIRENGNLWWQRANKLDISTEELYLIYFEIEKPVCTCNNEIPFINFSNGYQKSCGDKICKNNSMLVSIKKTNLKRHGVEHYFNNEKGMLTKLEKYGSGAYNNVQKGIITMKKL